MTRHALGDAVDPADTADPADPLDDDADLPWPSRPGAIELAAALLIVGGVIGVLGALSAASSLPAGVEPFLILTVALDIGSIIVGLLVRLGRSWIVAVNYVAVLGFLDLLGAGASALQLTLGLADILVVVILFVYKPWFDELRLRRSARLTDRRLNP